MGGSSITKFVSGVLSVDRYFFDKCNSPVSRTIVKSLFPAIQKNPIYHGFVKQ